MPTWTFPISPVAASRPRVSKFGHAYYTGPYKLFRQDMMQVKDSILGPDHVALPLDHLLEVDIDCYIKRPKTTKLLLPKADVDNYAKSILDQFNEVLWVDDRQIQRLGITKNWTENNEEEGYFVLSIEELSNDN
jgi:Holliday junction resolvase RusA-like endonuclease